MDYLQTIILSILFIIVGAVVTWLISKVSSKLDAVLVNQQTNEVIIAEIKKDVERTAKDSDLSAAQIIQIREEVGLLKVDVSALNEFKKNIENGRTN